MIDVALRKRSFLAEIMFRFSGVEPCYEPAVKVEISLLGCINQRGLFPCALKFEDAMLVVTCDVFFKYLSR